MDMETCLPGANYTKGNRELNDITYSGFKPNRGNKGINVGGEGWCKEVYMLVYHLDLC